MNARDDLRQALADAIRAAACNGDCDSTEAVCATKRVQPIVWHYGALALVEGTPEQLADAVLPLVAAERAAAYRAAADEIDAQQQREETTERALHGFLDHETELQGAAVRGMAQRLRTRADEMEQQ